MAAEFVNFDRAFQIVKAGKNLMRAIPLPQSIAGSNFNPEQAKITDRELHPRSKTEIAAHSAVLVFKAAWHQLPTTQLK